MTACTLFISYSHKDEWLKDELVTHLAALKRNKIIDVWHDRCIPAGGLLHEEIDNRLETSDIFLFLISPDFISSDYCFNKEYQAAVHRRASGDAEIVPIIIRPGDWDVGELKRFNALPRDGVPVTHAAVSRPDAQQRDACWAKIVDELKLVIAAQKKRTESPKLLPEYVGRLFEVDFVRHPNLSKFDERLIFVDPDIYFENTKEQISTIQRLFDICSAEPAILIIGGDRSGKTVIAKSLQQRFSEVRLPAILISGKDIRNKDIAKLLKSARTTQFGATSYPDNKFRVIIDDFDDCTLSDKIKEQIIDYICKKHPGCILVSFSNAPSVLFTSNSLPDPSFFRVNPVTNSKLFTLVQKWLSAGLEPGAAAVDSDVLGTFEKLQLVFAQTELQKSPYTAVAFLELLGSISGSDIAFSSFAACYDTLINSRLGKGGVNWGSFDEAKNFLSLVAYRAYSENGVGAISAASFEDCLQIFEQQFLSSPLTLRDMALRNFLKDEEKGYAFLEDYIWYFLCARYVAKTLQVNDNTKYKAFIEHCAANIFQKKFANIIIFIAYFSTDRLVLECLLKTLDGLFYKANNWLISDDTRELMIGLFNRDTLQIESQSDVTENRVALLQEKIADIIEDAEKVVAKYTLPFLHSQIPDSSSPEILEGGSTKIPTESYMQSVNALLRTHSVIGQILTARSGTFGADLVLDCITRMVKASGRYVDLNHSIAAVLIYDKANSLKEVDEAIPSDKLTLEEKFEKVIRIFAFWSVYISHAGLARYLSQDHSIRALEALVKNYESSTNKTEQGHIPFNFSFVWLVARLYRDGKIHRGDIEWFIKKYGEHSSVLALLRVVVHIYAYYMPLTIEDKQWLSNKLRMPLKRIELQRLKAVEGPRPRRS